jgi:hypothetical protein
MRDNKCTQDDQRIDNDDDDDDDDDYPDDRLLVMIRHLRCHAPTPSLVTSPSLAISLDISMCSRIQV